MNTTTKAIGADLEFVCVNEKDSLPPVDPQADIWFKQARDMQNARGEKNYENIAHLYRLAADKNHYKALINLQNLLYQQLAKPLPGKTEQEEVLAIAEKMMALNIAGGYYLMGYLLETGYAVKHDQAASLAYYRKAADMGSAQGQYVIGKLMLTGQFEDFDNPDPYIVKFKPNPAYRPEIGATMLSCAAKQGNGDAADWLAGWYQLIKKDYKNSIIFYQLGVKSGNIYSAMQMQMAFDSTTAGHRANYLALKEDLVRSNRYQKIIDEIDRNPLARFPDIDKIVPLPPAELPAWDGTFEYKNKKMTLTLKYREQRMWRIKLPSKLWGCIRGTGKIIIRLYFTSEVNLKELINTGRHKRRILVSPIINLIDNSIKLKDQD